MRRGGSEVEDRGGEGRWNWKIQKWNVCNSNQNLLSVVVGSVWLLGVCGC